VITRRPGTALPAVEMGEMKEAQRYFAAVDGRDLARRVVEIETHAAWIVVLGNDRL
jgi:hypothetical protein